MLVSIWKLITHLLSIMETYMKLKDIFRNARKSSITHKATRGGEIEMQGKIDSSTQFTSIKICTDGTIRISGDASITQQDN